MFNNNMGYGRKPAKRTMRKRRRTVRKPSKAIKRYVKAAIHRNIENKYFVDYAANQSISCAAVGAVSPTTLNLLPILNEGAEMGERLGNKVKLMGNYLNMYINILPYHAVTNTKHPINVRCWIVKYKLQNRNALSLNLNDWDNFFDVGTSTVGFQNNMLDMVLPVNKSQWIVYEERRFKLGVGAGSSSYGSSVTAYDDSSFNKLLKFHLAKHWRAPLDYQDSATSRPTNTNMFFVVQAVPSDGSVELGPLCELHYTQKFTYEDA